jgi:uncharacterized caspase-like protein
MGMVRRGLLILALVALVMAPATRAQQAEKRIAFVIGDAAYQAAPLQTPANDAGLIAQTLQTAGFEVVGARDLDQAAFVNAWNDFLAKAQEAGPDAVAFVYLAGYGVQFSGENYFASIDAQIAASSDIATNAIKLSDMSASLASVPLKARIFVLDAGRASPFALNDPSIAGGLALVDPDNGTLVAFNAAPGTIAPDQSGPYGPYAQALAEMIGQGGLPLDEVFIRTRLRVADTTKGAFLPWNVSKVTASFNFREGVPDDAAAKARALETKPIAELPPTDAYAAAERLDTIPAYQGFLAAYPRDPMAPRVRAMLAVRREAIVWRRTYLADAPNAYWSYLERYPRGPHVEDAHRRLEFLTAPIEPPPAFEVFAYDEPPPEPAEFIYVERPVFYFGEPAFAFIEPPLIPVYFVPRINPYFAVLPPPALAVGAMILPVPVIVPVIVNGQPYRPVRTVAVPVVVPVNRVGPAGAHFTPLANPRLTPANANAARPGLRLLSNPGAAPNTTPGAAKPLDASKRLPLVTSTAPTAPTARHDTAKLPPTTTVPNRLNAAKPPDVRVDRHHEARRPPDPGGHRIDAARPTFTGRPVDTRVHATTTTSTPPKPVVTAPKPVMSPPPAAAHVARPPPPPPAAAHVARPPPPPVNRAPPPKVSAAPARVASPPPCGKPGQPPCKR